MLAILHNMLQFLLRVLLKRVSVEEGITRLTCAIIEQLAILTSEHTKLLQATRLHARMSLLVLVFRVAVHVVWAE